MDYQGPTAEDLRNIRALNVAFLRATNCGDTPPGMTSWPLTEMQLQRLSEAPFLLFSFRERDAAYWNEILANEPQPDLLDDTRAPTERLHELQVAGLGFLWQLSRRNPYVARLVCGAPTNWCERIARLTLVDLIRRVACRGDLTTARFDAAGHVAHRLLQSGISAKPQLQRMSQQFALQSMLTGASGAQYEKLPAAACRFPVPAQRVADRGTRKGRKV